MATGDVIPEPETSFVYEDLFSRVQEIQSQVTGFENVLNARLENQKALQNELKSRTLVFIDPYRNRIVNKYMDHELISKIFKQFKKDYVPGILQRWIKLGTMNGDVILPLKDLKLKPNVSCYENGCQFVTFVEVNVWIEIYDRFLSQKVTIQTFVTDNMNKIAAQIKKQHQFDRAELMFCRGNVTEKPDQTIWDQSTKLNFNDTTLSRELYQDNCVIIAKLLYEKASFKLFFLLV